MIVLSCFRRHSTRSGSGLCHARGWTFRSAQGPASDARPPVSCDDDSVPEDSDEEENDEEFVMPEHDDPRYWEDFGADFDEDEPEPEPGDFWTSIDEAEMTMPPGRDSRSPAIDRR